MTSQENVQLQDVPHGESSLHVPVQPDPPLTPEDLLNHPEEERFELVDGELVERKVSSKSSWIAGELFGLLRDHCKREDLGWVWPPDNGFQCFADSPRTVRKPDVSFVAKDRLPDGPSGGYEKVVPDLVVEVLSPNDLALEVNAKIELFLHAGVRIIWVIDPEVRTAAVYRSDGSTSRLRFGDELDGESVISGFRCNISALFPPVGEESPA
ncbi:MAG: Uma2 family endonuclease [Planctomycetes bacterium]|nr:Uma2 family endonuclease [Planctomycetota bacterium]MBL7037946.1 Uma2 family endonuclease [Pirellulaceae bacterium]